MPDGFRTPGGSEPDFQSQNGHVVTIPTVNGWPKRTIAIPLHAPFAPLLTIKRAAIGKEILPGPVWISQNPRFQRRADRLPVQRLPILR